jgi:hypothetical protein
MAMSQLKSMTDRHPARQERRKPRAPEMAADRSDNHHPRPQLVPRTDLSREIRLSADALEFFSEEVGEQER